MSKDTIKKLFLWLLIPGVLLAFWLGMSLFFASDYSFSVLVSGYNKEHIENYKTTELFEGEKVVGRFEAKEDNLGIVAVRFFNFNRISEDYVDFRLKEEGSDTWYYENRYKVDQFQPHELFTFGFPLINDSSGKEYVFEIESVQGERGNAIALSPKEPTFVAQYQYSISELLANKTEIPIFLAKKIYYSFSDVNFATSSVLYLLPFILYMSWLLYLRKYTTRSNFFLFYTFAGSVLAFIFLMQDLNRIVELMLLGIWIFLIIYYRFESSVSFLLALLFLSMTPILLIFGKEIIAENAAIWTYFFLVVGTGQAVYELWKAPKNLITYDTFLPLQKKKNSTRSTKKKKK